MTTKNNEHARIFIAGGYGLVGGTIARHTRKIHANAELTLAGRNPDKAESLANELGKTETAYLDLDKTVNAEDLAGHDLIIAALQDRAEKLTEIAIDLKAELNEPDPDTFYTPGPEGYTDYPALAEALSE